MSIYSDHKVGALDDVEFHNLCVEENARERAYIDEWERLADEDLVIDNDSEEYPYGRNDWQE